MFKVFIVQLEWKNYMPHLSKLRSLLSLDEQQRASTWIDTQNQDKFVIIRGMLRILLSNFLEHKPAEIIFSYNTWGKPILFHPNAIHFNLSHSKEWVIYAFCKETPIGIDIEYQNPNIPIIKLARRYFSSCENAILNTLNTDKKIKGFYQAWVQKEAAIKALGLGFYFPLTKVEVNLAPQEPYTIRLTGEHLRLYPLQIKAGWKGALAVSTSAKNITLEFLSPSFLSTPPL
jgi:4'-phosphopantetheinyl transferase